VKIANRPLAGLQAPLLAFLLAPLIVPALYLAAAYAFGGFLSVDLAIVIGKIAYAAAILGGVPLTTVLGRLGWVSLHDYMVFGFLLGAMSVLVSEHAPIEFAVMIQAGLAALSGAIAAAIFWLIARPDRRRRGARV
jgi:hypothetical protein